MERLAALLFVAVFGVLTLSGCSGPREVDPLPTGSPSQSDAGGVPGGSWGGTSGGY